MGSILKIGHLSFDRGDPKIVSVVPKDESIVGDYTDNFVADVTEAKANGADIIEIRIDFFSDSNSALTALKRFKETPEIASIPSIATIYPQGSPTGGFKGTENERFELFKNVMNFVDAVDIGYNATKIRDSVIEEAHRRDKAVVLSHFLGSTSTYEKMKGLLENMFKITADCYKLTAPAKELEDMVQLTYVLLDMIDLHPDKPTATISTGENGLPSRVIFPMLGSYLTYGFLDPNPKSQVHVRYLRNTLDLLRVSIPLIQDIRETHQIPPDLLEVLQ